MTAAHFVYIPCAIMAGIVIGWILGGRSAREFYENEKRKAEDKARRAAERAQKQQ